MSILETHTRGVTVLLSAALLLGVLQACSAASVSGDAVGGQSNSGAGGAGAGGEFGAGGAMTTGGAANAGGAKATGGGPMLATGGAATASAPTWTQLYNNYFGPGTAGDCVASGCHGSGQRPSFNNAITMCSALKSYGIIGSGTASFGLVLKWFNQGGNMPANGGATPANAVADITAWQNAGAVCP